MRELLFDVASIRIACCTRDNVPRSYRSNDRDQRNFRRSIPVVLNRVIFKIFVMYDAVAAFERAKQLHVDEKPVAARDLECFDHSAIGADRSLLMVIREPAA